MTAKSLTLQPIGAQHAGAITGAGASSGNSAPDFLRPPSPPPLYSLNFGGEDRIFDCMHQIRETYQSPRAEYPLSDVQLQALLTHTLKPRDRIILELMAFSGLRVMEVARLEIARLDFAARLVQVVGKGGKIRNVPIPSFLADKLRKYIGRRVQGYVFLTPRAKRKGEHLSIRAIQEMIRAAGDRIGFRQQCPTLTHLSPHQLRHTCGRRMKDVGFDYEEIAKILGHSSIAKVAMMYGRKTMQEVQKKADERLFNLRIE